jgi:hypothetical protein
MTIDFKHTSTSDDKLELFGYGEWVEEPDEASFFSEGFLCAIFRNRMGALCGYIRIPEDHHWRGVSLVDFCTGKVEGPDIHGCITYAEQYEDGYWIGFDCAHTGDIVPLVEASYKERPETRGRLANFQKKEEDLIFQILRDLPERSYKNMNFVIEQCKSLARQARNLQEEIKNSS